MAYMSVWLFSSVTKKQQLFASEKLNTERTLKGQRDLFDDYGDALHLCSALEGT